MLKKTNINSQPYIGVFSVSSEELTITPPIEEGVFTEALETEVVKTTVGGTWLCGALSCANTKGILFPDMAEEREIETLIEHKEVTILPEKHNALGNNILVNDNGALINPDLDDFSKEAIESFLEVDVEEGTIAGIKMVGSLGLVTNKGLICHPHVSEDEKEMMEDLFKTPVKKTTANHGSGWIGTCMVANSKGAVIGDRTTPIEMGRIEEGLGYLE